MRSTATLETVATFSKGSGLAKSDLVADGAYPCIHYGELFTQYGAIIEAVQSRTNLILPVRSIEGDVLMPTSDVTPRGLAKASAIHQSGVTLGGDILIIRPIQTKADSRFVAYAIRHDVNQVLALVRGSTVYHLYAADMRNFVLHLPSPPEQARIAEGLSDADHLIASLDRLIAKKQEIKQGMMQQLLTGKIRLPGFTAPWPTRPLGTLGTFLKGRGVKRDDVRGSGVRCVRYGELYTAFHDYTAEVEAFVSADVARTALPLRYGDLMFAGSGETHEEIGKCVAYVGPTPAVAGGDVLILRGDHFNPIYLALLVNAPEVASQKARAGQGDAVVHIYSHHLATIEVMLPQSDEQDAIAQLFVDVDTEIRVLRRRLRKAKNVKQGMMQGLLTGRTRLPVAEAAI